MGANPDGEQTWAVYARSVLAFSAVGVLFLYGLQRVQVCYGPRRTFRVSPTTSLETPRSRL